MQIVDSDDSSFTVEMTLLEELKRFKAVVKYQFGRGKINAEEEVEVEGNNFYIDCRTAFAFLSLL